MITVEMVLDAYKQTSFKPSRRTFYALPHACCPIGAIAYISGCLKDGVCADLDLVTARFGWSRDYLWDFANGFDGLKGDGPGYQDGKAAYAALTDVREEP